MLDNIITEYLGKKRKYKTLKSTSRITINKSKKKNYKKLKNSKTRKNKRHYLSIGGAKPPKLKPTGSNSDKKKVRKEKKKKY